MYNIFISYRRKGGFAVARLLYDHLRIMGFAPFFDMEELRSGQFNIKLYDTIDECDNFLLILPPNSLDRCVNTDDWLRLEIERAITKKKNIIPVVLDGFSFSNIPDCMIDLSKYNAVSLSQEYFDASLKKIISMLRNVQVIPVESKPSIIENERKKNTYFSMEDKKEVKRLHIQQKLFKSFDRDVYSKIINEYDELKILDIGCGIGEVIMDRLGSSTKTYKLLGIEYDKEAVDSANQHYAEGNKINFVQADVETEDFQDFLEETMNKYEVDSFNIVNISMVLLHLKKPYKLLKTIRKVMAKDGIIIIKDIDDGFNIAYPDENKLFERVVQICINKNESGYRLSGRQIYTFLKRAGFNNIVLEKLAMTTTSMDCDERSALFDVYFRMVFNDLKKKYEENPLDNQTKQDYLWYSKNIENLEELFQADDFFFSLGLMLYTARK